MCVVIIDGVIIPQTVGEGGKVHPLSTKSKNELHSLLITVMLFYDCKEVRMKVKFQLLGL